MALERLDEVTAGCQIPDVLLCLGARLRGIE
jgi:hypothetical protein